MDFSQIMKQAQEMQKKLAEAQEKYVGKEFQGISGGGKISVLAEVIKIGSYKVKKVNIDLELMRNEEKDVVEDLIAAAFNDAIKKAEEDMANATSDLAGMMGLPPGFKLPYNRGCVMLVDVVKKSASLVKKYLKNKPKSVDNKVSTRTEDVNIVADVTSVIDNLISAYESYSPQSDNKEKLKNYIGKLSSFISLKDKIAKCNLSTKDSAIEKFCRLIAENEDLHKELGSLSVQSEKDDSKELYSRLGKIIEKFNISQLQKKVLFLQKLKDKDDFDTLRKDYQDEWKFYGLLQDLTNDKEFKQTYIDKVIEEKDKLSCSNLKEGISACTKSMQQGKEAASKYFEEGTELQAYYTEVNSENRILNINLVDSNRSEPTKVSDILQQEKGTNELNIYFNKKREVYASQDKDKKRYYKFEKGAHYEMTSTWPVKDKDGNISICTMVMHVSDEGITKILDFDDGTESQLQYKEFIEYIKQNHELYIQDFSLHDAVEKLWGLRCEERLKVIENSNEQVPAKLPDVVLKASEVLQYDKAVNTAQSTNQNVSGVEPERNVIIPQNQSNNLGNLTSDKAITPITSTNEVGQPKEGESTPNVNFNNLITNKSKLSVPGNAGQQPSTQPKVPFQEQALPKQLAVQAAATLKQAGTQTEVDLLSKNSIQAEAYSEKAYTQAESNLQDTATQTEINLQDASAQTEVNLQGISTQAEVNLQDTSAQTEVNLQDTSTQTEVKAKYIDDLRLTNRRLHKENVESKQLIESGWERLDNLEKRNQQLDKERNEAKIESKKWLTEAKSLANTLSERDQKNEKIKHVNRQLKDALDELNGEKADLEDELKKNKQKLEKRDNAYQILMQVNSDREMEIAESQEENGKLREESRQLKENLKNSNVENTRLKNELKKLQAELIQVQKEAEDIINSTGKIREDSKREMSELDKKRKEQLEGLKEEIKSLKEEYENRLKNYKEQIRNLELKLHKLAYELESQKRKTAELEYDVKEQEGDLQRKDRQIEEERELFRKEMESKKEKFQNAERIYRELQASYRELQARYQALEMTHEKVTQFEEEMKKFEQSIGPLKLMITGPNKLSIADAYSELVEKKDREIDQLEELIADKIVKITELEENIKNLTGQINTMNELLDGTQRKEMGRLLDPEAFKTFLNFTEAVADSCSSFLSHTQRSSVSDSDYASNSDSEVEVYVTPSSSPLSTPNARRFSRKQEDIKSINSSYHADKEIERKSNSSSPLPDVINR